MSKSLPDRPNLDHLKNEAKALLKAHRSGESDVCGTLRHVPRLENASDEQVLAAEVSLQEVQHALAQEYGFQSWKELSDHVAGESAFAGLVQAAMAVFTAKGPHQDSTGSAYEQRRAAETQRLLSAGDDGFRVMMALARSDNGRARNAAAIFFLLSDDGRATEELRRLLTDESVMVRSRSVRFYAARIHPKRRKGDAWGISEPAETLPEGVEAILPLVGDSNVKVQLDVISALSAYARLDDARILGALRQALSDPKHKVQHAAARGLGLPCPKCGSL